MDDLNERLTNLEMYVANQEKVMDELNSELIRLSKLTDKLVAQNKVLMEALKESPVKPLSEETPPPHY